MNSQYLKDLDSLHLQSQNLFKIYGVYVTKYAGFGYKIGHTKDIIKRNRFARNDGWSCELSETILFGLQHVYPTDFKVIRKDSKKECSEYYFSATELFLHACFSNKRIAECNNLKGSTEIFKLNWFDRNIKLPFIMKIVGAKVFTPEQLIEIEKEYDSYFKIATNLMETAKFFANFFRFFDGEVKHDNPRMYSIFTKINENNSSQFTCLESAQQFFDRHLKMFPNASSSKFLIKLQKFVLRCVDELNELNERNDGRRFSEEISSNFTRASTIDDRKIAIFINKEVTPKHWLYGQISLEIEREGENRCLIFSPRKNFSNMQCNDTNIN